MTPHISDIPEGDIREHLQGPELSVLCALGVQPTPDAFVQQCLTCHEGAIAAFDQFPTWHRQQLQAKTCRLCHKPDGMTTHGHEPPTGGEGMSHVSCACSQQQQCRNCHLRVTAL